jgi:hypothetical protein
MKRDKTAQLNLVTRKNAKDEFDYVTEQNVMVQRSYKYLGVTINYNMDLSENLDKIIKKLNMHKNKMKLTLAQFCVR